MHRIPGGCTYHIQVRDLRFIVFFKREYELALRLWRLKAGDHIKVNRHVVLELITVAHEVTWAKDGDQIQNICETHLFGPMTKHPWNWNSKDETSNSRRKLKKSAKASVRNESDTKPNKIPINRSGRDDDEITV